MRLFIALDLPKAIILHIRRLQQALDKGSARLNLAKSYHLTLKFLGEVDEEKIVDIISCLNSVRFKKFTLTTSDIGVFRDFEHVNVIWLGLKHNDALSELVREIEKSLRRFTFKKEFEFHPHITLARVSYVISKGRMRANLESILPKEKKFRVDNFKLFRSTLTQDGPKYGLIEEFKVS